MHCVSLRHDGDQLLADVTEHVPNTPWASGIPLLHPWANRLGGFEYTFDGVAVALDRADLYLEEHGLPLHGLRAAVTGWEPTFANEKRIVAGRDVTEAAFPFPHRVTVAAELSPFTLTITTTLTAGERPVPIAFGYHPFLQLPGVPRAEWEITLPVEEHIAVDERLIPTGERAPAGQLDGPLADRTFDDGYTYAGGPFVLEGGDRRIEVVFEEGYGYAQVFAPSIADLVCFEPMTAAADALRHGPSSVPPGESFTARFSVTIMRVSER
jgi:aldose 1-epimerase